MMNLRTKPTRLFHTVVNGRFPSLHWIHEGMLNKVASSQASNHERGIENSHKSHCASDIPKTWRRLSVEGMIRSAKVGELCCSWAYRPGIAATLSLERSQILPAVGSSTRTRITGTFLFPTFHTPART